MFCPKGGRHTSFRIRWLRDNLATGISVKHYVVNRSGSVCRDLPVRQRNSFHNQLALSIFQFTCLRTTEALITRGGF